jgi:hypothetical protein
VTREPRTRRAPQLKDVQHLTTDYAFGPVAEVIEKGGAYALAIEVPCVPPSPNRELPHVRKRALGESRWSVRRDWAQWSMLWLRMAMNRWRWVPAEEGQLARVCVWQARVRLLDAGNLEYSVKGAVDGTKLVMYRRKVSGILAPVAGAGAIYEDDPRHLPNQGDRRGLDVRQCKVSRYADERTRILVDRQPGAGIDYAPHWYAHPVRPAPRTA